MRLFAPGRTESQRGVLDRASRASPTYGGPSLEELSEPPGGFALDRHSCHIGHGDTAFATARSGLQRWASHQVVGVRIVPPDTSVALGATYVVSLGLGVCAIAAPCRVVAIRDDERHWGFAYRTLPGHPETGEESFVVELDDRGDVTFSIAAVSRPAGRLMSIGRPVARIVQRRVSLAYGRSLAAYVASVRTPQA
jgi:uncharacterized protein (UPF0548 family)